VALLLGDYHLTSALLDTHGTAVDLEFDTRRGPDGGLPSEVCQLASAAARSHAAVRGGPGWHLLHARCAYRQAERTGRGLDRLLETNYHQDLVAARTTLIG
jgi:hypothetical protein